MEKTKLLATVLVVAIGLGFGVYFALSTDQEPAVETEAEAEPPPSAEESFAHCKSEPESCYVEALEITEHTDFETGDFARIRALFEASCEGGFALACQDRAVMADEGIGQDQNREEAIAFYGMACEFGHEPACTSVQLLSSAQPGRGPTYWVENCDAGELHDCIQMGIHLERGGQPIDEREAADFLRQACEGGESEGCYWLARNLDRVGSGATDAELEALYASACDGGMARACAALGRRLDARDVGPEQLEPILERACQLQDGHGCYHLGLYRHRNGDTEAAIAAWRAGCDLWNGLACHHLGQALLRVPEEESAPYFERGCQMGVAGACFNFAVHLNTTQSPPPLERSRELFERACRGDHLQACAFLATMLREGQGGPRDVRRADEIAKKACEGGVQMACGRPSGI